MTRHFKLYFIIIGGSLIHYKIINKINLCNIFFNHQAMIAEFRWNGTSILNIELMISNTISVGVKD